MISRSETLLMQQVGVLRGNRSFQQQGWYTVMPSRVQNSLNSWVESKQTNHSRDMLIIPKHGQTDNSESGYIPQIGDYHIEG